MNRPTVKFFDVETNEELIREMNDEEYAVHLTVVEKAAINIAKFEQAQETKAALLNRLGITEEEAKLLLS